MKTNFTITSSIYSGHPYGIIFRTTYLFLFLLAINLTPSWGQEQMQTKASVITSMMESKTGENKQEVKLSVEKSLSTRLQKTQAFKSTNLEELEIDKVPANSIREQGSIESDAPLANRTASVSGNWNSTATWGGSSVPIAGDAVTINSGITVTVTAPAACASITFANNNSNNSTITISGTNTLSISGLIRMRQPNTNNISQILNVNSGLVVCGALQMDANTNTRLNVVNITSGTFTINGDITTTNNTNFCQISLSGTGILNIGGNFTTNDPTLTTVSGSTVNYNRTGNQTVLNVNYNGNLTFAGSGIKTMGSGTTSVGGNLILNGTSTVWVFSGLTINGTVTINTGTTIDITGYSLNVGANWTNNGGTLISYTSPYPSTITFNGSGAQIINGTASSQTFFNLKVRKPAGVITTGGSTTTLNIDGLTMIQGDFTLPPTTNIISNISQVGGTLDAGANIYVGKHWYLYGGSFNHNSGTVTFNGVIPQNISGNITFNNIITSTPGVVNLDAGNIYNTGFEGSISDWLWSYVSGLTPIYIENNGTNPTCTPSEGTQMIVFNSYYIYDGSTGDQSRFFLTSPFSTYGKTGINVAFDWYEDNGYPPNNDRVTIQYSTDGSIWTNLTTYSRYNAVTGWKTKICSLPIAAENQVELYIAFLFTSEWGNNCHIDNVKVTGSPITPSTVTVANTHNLTNGTYTIGGGNLLVLNGDVTGTNPLVGGNASNLTVSGTSANLTLPNVTNGLNNFTITRPNGATIRYDRNLTVTGTLNNTQGTGGLTIQSTTDGTGSLLHNTDNVEATIERYVSGSTDLLAKRYHFVSVPLTPASDNYSIIFLYSYLFRFNEPTRKWVGLGTPVDRLLYEQRGYMTFAPFDGATYYFRGPINNGNFLDSTFYTYHVNPDSCGWNLVPNPYPSAIDWNATSGWTKTNIASYIYFWNATIGQYAAYNGVGQNGASQYIPVGQAFFVHATGASPVLSMNNNVRLHHLQPFLKNGTEIIPNLLRLNASTNLSSDEIVVRIHEDATDNFDAEFDAYKLTGGADAPQLASVTEDGTKLSINSLPYSATEKIIPLDFSLSKASEVNFTATGQESFNMTPPIYLEDLLLGTVIDLQQQPVYTFMYQPGQNNRFRLHFYDITADNNAPMSEGKIFYSNGKIHIDVPTMEGKDAVVQVFDMAGRQLSATRILINGIAQIKAPIARGVYIIRLLSSNETFTERVVIH